MYVLGSKKRLIAENTALSLVPEASSVDNSSRRSDLHLSRFEMSNIYGKISSGWGRGNFI